MSNGKKYIYKKFDKLSDAVIASEKGLNVYILTKGGSYLERGRRPNGDIFSTKKDYYYREAVKPFELWAAIAQGKIIMGTGFDAAILKQVYPRARIIKMREVIGGEKK